MHVPDITAAESPRHLTPAEARDYADGWNACAETVNNAEQERAAAKDRLENDTPFKASELSIFLEVMYQKNVLRQQNEEMQKQLKEVTQTVEELKSIGESSNAERDYKNGLKSLLKVHTLGRSRAMPPDEHEEIATSIRELLAAHSTPKEGPQHGR